MYKIKLNNEQIQTIYNITDNKDKQSKLMSILSYLIKYTDFTTNKLTKSLNRLYTMYIRLEYRKITRSYFYTLVDLLKEFKLFIIPEGKIEDILQDKTNVTEIVENTSLKENFKKHNNLILNNTNTYTLYTESSSVNALDLVDEVFNDFKIKSKIIKSMVVAKLENVKLDAKGAVAYIVKVITEKTEQYNNMRVEYAKAVAKTKYSKSKNTYVAPVKNNTRTFNNFEPRAYDYDSLEKKLLGWDNQ